MSVRALVGTFCAVAAWGLLPGPAWAQAAGAGPSRPSSAGSNADLCATAVVIPEGQTASNNTGFGTEGVASCSSSGADAWFLHTALCSGQLRVDTSGSSIDTVLAVFDGCDGVELACDDDGGAGSTSALTLTVSAGEDYLIRVAGFNNAMGDILVTLTRLDTCHVDGQCFADRAASPASECQVCDPDLDPNAFSPRPKGALCGEQTPSDPQCDAPDSCDGLGSCDPNHKPSGLACGNPAATDCDAADTCDGLGFCDDNLRPVGFACGSGSESDCDHADTCDGAGGCLTNIEPAGMACGSPVDTDCDHPDTCDGIGACLPNLEADGTPCPNGLFCDGDEQCLAGLCADQPDPCIGAVDCDEDNDVCLDCFDVSDCGDVDPANGVTDNNCIWYACSGNSCNEIDRIFGDAGGAFGDCLPDGFTNLFDRNHVLNCFAMTNPCDAINIDVGGAFGNCNPDGFCNLQDVNHVLTAFEGTNTCACPSDGPAPVVAPRVRGKAGLLLEADRSSAAPGEIIHVQVRLATPLESLQSYQLEAQVSGSGRGGLELIEVGIEPQAGHVFAGMDGAFSAFNARTAQMLSGVDHDALHIPRGAYLATFTYRVSRDAAGTFVVDVAHRGAGQSALVASFFDRYEIAARPAVITVGRGLSGPSGSRK